MALQYKYLEDRIAYVKNNSFSSSQHYLSDFHNGVGCYDAWLTRGLLICICLSFFVVLSDQDPTVAFCALLNVAAFRFGCLVLGSLHVEIQKMVVDKGAWILALLTIPRMLLRFSIIQITFLPVEDLIRGYKLPPPLAPNSRC